MFVVTTAEKEGALMQDLAPNSLMLFFPRLFRVWDHLRTEFRAACASLRACARTFGESG